MHLKFLVWCMCVCVGGRAYKIIAILFSALPPARPIEEKGVKSYYSRGSLLTIYMIHSMQYPFDICTRPRCRVCV